jgi:hypothetical protein
MLLNDITEGTRWSALTDHEEHPNGEVVPLQHVCCIAQLPLDHPAMGEPATRQQYQLLCEAFMDLRETVMALREEVLGIAS